MKNAPRVMPVFFERVVRALAAREPMAQARKQKARPVGRALQFGGEGGIRTLDTLPYTHFPGVLLQPLGHLTKFSTRV